MTQGPAEGNKASGFELGALYRSVDAQRAELGLSWAALSRQVGVAASTIRRFATAKDAEADGVLALVRWLGAKPEEFIASSGRRGECLHPAGEGVVRVDIAAIAAASNRPALVGQRTRLTIQQLAEVANESGQSVASLTRVCEV